MTFRRIFRLFAVILLVGALEARTTGSQLSGGIHGGTMPSTSFTCRGRETGYYADVEADCQSYHMCDQQGRQFSYLCPNATLFQQRMLICDHWYMVDCLKSEANYEFNRLIGQRDQHFVSDSDAIKRTPRPDLLDRPYAADYKGESFRKAIGKSNFPAFQNAIAGFTKNVDRKYEILETQASSNILPPQFDTNTLDPTLIPASEEFPRTDKTNERRNAFSGESVENSLRRMSPPPTGFEPPKLLPTYNDEFRRQEEARLKQLGLPLQTVTSQNQQQKNTVTRFNAPQPAASQFKPTVRPVTTSLQSTKKPADKTFDPDKNFKAFEHILQPGKTATHKDYDFSRYFTKKQKSDPTTAPVQRRQDFGSLNRQQVTVSTTKRNFVQQTTTPTTTTQRATTTTTVRPQTSRVTATTTKRPVTQTARIQTFNQPSAFNQIQQSNQFGRPSTIAPRQNEIVAPARDLLPPLDVLRSYDDATTRGPAVYYEWKVPESGLLPPKLENDTEAQSKRSITEEGNFDNDFHSSESRRVGHGNSIKIQYKDLQKLFAIPQFDFPIESSGRDGYENTEAVNSFQVKIPYKASDKQEGRYYYLEHAHCNPECHPYFFKPGRCEPCIKL